MQISIDAKVLEKYPEAEIGFLIANVSVQKTNSFVESLKKDLFQYLQQQGLNATNFVAHPSIAIWRRIYEDFQVKAKNFPSSIESLVRRVITGKELWNICNIVDLYNCLSIFSLLPMGAYDLNKVSGDINIRYGRQGEFFRGIGAKEKVAVQVEQIVYADEKRTLCWLWNYKDAEETCIDENTKKVIFFIDSIGNSSHLRATLNELKENLIRIQCVPCESGILNKATSQILMSQV